MDTEDNADADAKIAEIEFDKKYEEEGVLAKAYGVCNKLELRKIKYVERMSEETNCFVADVYMDGQRIGSMQNDGHGGPNQWSLANVVAVKDYPLMDRWVDDTLEAYLKAKEQARIAKWIDKNVAKFREKGWRTAVITEGNEMRLACTKAETAADFLAKNPKFAKPSILIEIRK
jgi:hypothetical protein